MHGLIACAVLLGVMAALPHVVELYHVDILILFLVNLLLAQSYRLVTTTGDWSLCHVVLMGSGAYATALVTKHLGWPFWLGVPMAGVAGALVALAVVAPLLRTIGFGFFIGSFALGEFVREQPAPRVGPGLVAPGCEDDVITEGKGARRQRSRHHCLARAVMDPHRAEVATESRLEEIARGRVERPA